MKVYVTGRNGQRVLAAQRVVDSTDHEVVFYVGDCDYVVCVGDAEQTITLSTPDKSWEFLSLWGLKEVLS